MGDPVIVHLFLEDRAHEEWIVSLLRRLAREEQVAVLPEIRSARGGHGRVVLELRLYQRTLDRHVAGAGLPDLLIAGIDGNCSSFARAKKAIEDATVAPLSDRLVVACPDPHVERWYLADPESFHAVVGFRPAVGKKKCARDHYKRLLENAVRKAGHPPTLGGIDFAAALASRMDLYRAGKSDRSLRAFVDDLRTRLRTLGRMKRGDAS